MGRLIINAQIIRNDLANGTFEVLSAGGKKEDRTMKKNAEPTKRQIEEQVKRFLQGLDTHDLRKNPLLSHELIGIQQRHFAYRRMDQHGNEVFLQRSFSITDGGDLDISGSAEKLTARGLEAFLATNAARVPEMPRMRWNENHTPDFSHLQKEKDGPKVNAGGAPSMPRPRWHRNGTPDFRHLNQ
jgi:hypothetical protein